MLPAESVPGVFEEYDKCRTVDMASDCGVNVIIRGTLVGGKSYRASVVV